METTMWITKDEICQVASCEVDRLIDGSVMRETDMTEQQLSNYQMFNSQRSCIFGSDEYGRDLENASFCMDDFFVADNCSTEAACGQSIDKRQDHGRTFQHEPPSNVRLVASEPGMSSLRVKTDEMAAQNGCWSTTGYECQSPDSGINVDTAFSPNSDFGRSCNESPAANLGSPGSVASSFSSSCSENGAWNQNDVGLEIYHDLIMRHLVQDIKATSVRLSIPQDPKQWTLSDCRAWLTDMAAQYHLTQVPYDNFNVDGATLCDMSLVQFSQRFPNGGETVHAQLQIWNSANEYCQRQETGSNAKVSFGLESPSATGNGKRRFFAPGEPMMQQQPIDDWAQGYPKAQMMNQFHTHPIQLCPDQTSPAAAQYSLSALLPSPGSCSESGSMSGYDASGEAASNGASTATNANNIHLWQFLRELLEQQDKYSNCVRWIDQRAGIFKIEDSHKLARLWGQRKNRPAMNYDKLSRSLRQYYKKNILKKTARSQRLVYQFLHPYHMC